MKQAKPLLALLEESIAPLLPVKISFVEDQGQAHLFFGKTPVARIYLEANGLTPEELSRWQPAVLALAQELWQRLLREKCIEGLPGRDILRRELKTRPLTGLIFQGKRPPKASFALDQGLYLLELSPKEVVPLLKDYWRKGERFIAASVGLKAPEDLETVEDLIFLAKALGFTWLSAKAQKEWARQGVSLSEAAKHLGPLLEAWAQGAALLWAEGPSARLENLISLAKHHLPWGEQQMLLALATSLEEAVEYVEDLGLRAGLYAQGAELPPLAATWAALEHARRLPEPRAVVFEPFTYHVAGDLYLDLGDLGAAQYCYLQGLEGTAQPVDLLNSLAVIMVQLGKPQEAQKYLEEAISKDPQDPMLHYNLGLFLRERDAQAAHKAFKKAYALAPTEKTFAEAWAEVLAQEGRWAEVEKVLDPIEPSPSGLFLKARALYEQGDLEQAFGLFKELVRQEPKHARGLAYLALLFAQLEGEEELAQSLAQQALQNDPEVEGLVAGLLEEKEGEEL